MLENPTFIVTRPRLTDGAHMGRYNQYLTTYQNLSNYDGGQMGLW